MNDNTSRDPRFHMCEDHASSSRPTRFERITDFVRDIWAYTPVLSVLAHGAVIGMFAGAIGVAADILSSAEGYPGAIIGLIIGASIGGLMGLASWAANV